MERPRRKLFIGIVLLLVAFIVVREAFFGYTIYLVRVPAAKLFADGKPEKGWLHRGARGKTLILTRTVSGKRESYWIEYPGEKGGWVSSCGEWTAGKFPIIAIGDVNPPCFSIRADPGTEVVPQRRLRSKRAPLFGTQFVEFTADDGDRLRVIW